MRRAGEKGAAQRARARARVCERRASGGGELAPETARQELGSSTRVAAECGEREEERREGLGPGRPGGCVREGGGDG